MAGSSTLDPDNFPRRKKGDTPKGHDTKSLGPSDSSDSGSDMAGPGLIDDERIGLDRGTNEDSEGGDRTIADAGTSIGDREMDSDSDRFGTGEHRAAGKDPRERANADVDADRVVGASGAGLGAGLDQAEEAQLGITDEEIEAELEREDAPFEVANQTDLQPAPGSRKPRLKTAQQQPSKAVKSARNTRGNTSGKRGR